MTTHSIHEDVHEHGLADGCERCTEHANHPLRDLDATVLGGLTQRVVAGLEPRSKNEEEAMYHVRKTLDDAGKLARVNGTAVIRYLNEKWGLKSVVGV